ncbi:MAG: glycoside hydrolase family 3 protein [Spongiibacteraceae bacterium]|nr:glycoside hydrolase family 3 protein [Spongiibacteraceae bacterium]
MNVKKLSLMVLIAIAVLLVGCISSSVDTRVEATFSTMSEREKIRLLHGPMTRMVPKSKRPEGVAIGAGYIEGVPRLGIPHLVETDASLGVSNLMKMRRGDVATALASGLSLAATWDPELARQGGQMIGSEARAKGFNVMLVGGVNLVRDPRAGRNFEYLGEDPLLAGMMVGAQIDGVQSNNIIATIKHLALNDQETGRNVASVEMDEASMRESDLLAFEIGIEQGNPGSVMCAYNQVGGIYSCEHPFLLNDVLRRDWHYKGYVMSDWGAVHSTEAILAGLDQQSGEQLDGKKYFSTLLAEAVKEKRIPQSAVDTSVKRILHSIFTYGVADNPLQGATDIDYNANAKVALNAAEQGIVLLRNESNLLPLDKNVRSIVVIGSNADIGVPSGGGSSQVTPVGGFKQLTRGVRKGPAATFALRGYGGTAPLNGLRQVLPNTEITYVDGKDVKVAAEHAKSADVAIVFVEKYAAEAIDHEGISLGEGQDQLIAVVAAVNPKTVVVLQTGNPVAMPWNNKVASIVSAWYSGQQGGLAIARVLTGEVNPSGHLPVTFPQSIRQLPNPQLPGADMPPADKQTRAVYGLMASSAPFDIHYPEGSDVGYRWFDKKQLTPLYPFGHGLSYTQFEYSDLQVSSRRGLSVSFSVKNIGSLSGADVPQVYIVREGKAKRLIGWAKPNLDPAQRETVSIKADLRVLADFDTDGNQWIVPEGEYRIEIARSATDVVLVDTVKIARKTIKP